MPTPLSRISARSRAFKEGRAAIPGAAEGFEASDEERIEEEEEEETGMGGTGIEGGCEVGIEGGCEVGIERGCEVGIERGCEVGIERGCEVGIERGCEVGIEKGFEDENELRSVELGVLEANSVEESVERVENESVEGTAEEGRGGGRTAFTTFTLSGIVAAAGLLVCRTVVEWSSDM